MRIAELDCMRGVTILTIFLNHYTQFARILGYDGRAVPTLTHYGYSSAAELFFLMSGYLVGLLYLPADRPVSQQKVGARLVGRAVYLVAMNCFLFVAVLALGWFLPQAIRAGLGLAIIDSDPHRVGVNLLALRHHIPLLGILNFYVIMMLATVPLLWLLRRNSLAVLGLSLALYLIAQIAPELAPEGGAFQGGNGRLSFNPLAWQILFLAALIAGRHQLHLPVMAWLDRRRNTLAVMAAFLAISLLYRVDMGMGGLIERAWYDKQNLAPLRLIHALFAAAFLFALCHGLARFAGSLPYRALSLIGRYSLQGFMAGVVLSYGMAALWAMEPQAGLAAYLAFALLGGCAQYLLALGLDMHAHARRGTLRQIRP